MAKHAEYFNAMPAWLTAAQRILGSQPFFGGGPGPSYGDFALFHIVDLTLLVQPNSLDAFPGLSAWFKSIRALPAIAAYLEVRPTKATPGWGKPGSFLTQ